jgi:DNA-binding NarL/FixJ family response regulator
MRLHVGTRARLVCDDQEARWVDPDQDAGLSCRVLVVDDDPEFAAALAGALRLEPGMQVSVAIGVDEGIAAARRGVDVALVDVRMPGGGGPELARRIGCSRLGVAVVAMSATADHAARATMHAAGAVGFLDKSDPIEVVCASVRVAYGLPSPRLAEQP